MGILILIPFAAIMYFMLIRPQQKRANELKAVLASLEEGDEVLTSSGIYGVITEFDGPTVFIEVADGVEIKIAKETITTLVNYDADADSDSSDAKGPIS